MPKTTTRLYAPRDHEITRADLVECLLRELGGALGAISIVVIALAFFTA